MFSSYIADDSGRAVVVLVANRAMPKSVVMPGNVRPGQVISLVEITGGMGPRLDVPRVADEMAADIAVLFPIIDAAQMLGLVKLEKGDLLLTEDGQKFQKSLKNKVMTLRERLAAIEPFKTALELASRKRGIGAAEVADALQSRGIRWHHHPEDNEAIINDLLLHWGIPAGLLSYGRAGEFHKI